MPMHWNRTVTMENVAVEGAIMERVVKQRQSKPIIGDRGQENSKNGFTRQVESSRSRKCESGLGVLEEPAPRFVFLIYAT